MAVYNLRMYIKEGNPGSKSIKRDYLMEIILCVDGVSFVICLTVLWLTVLCLTVLWLTVLWLTVLVFVVDWHHGFFPQCFMTFALLN